MGSTHVYRGSGRAGEAVDRNPGAVGRIPAATTPEGWRLRLMSAGWNSAWELMRRLPEPVAFALADGLGLACHALSRRARRRVRANLARVIGEGQMLDSAVRGAFRSYARYWAEAFRVADLDPADLDARTTTEGFEHLDAALEAGRGAIVLLAHHGSWDVAACWAESHGYHLAVVVEVVRPRVLFDKFVRLREGIGLEVVPLLRGKDVAGRLTDVLAANHLVGLLSDRDLTGRAPFAELFGEPCRIPAGPAVLARRTGAAIVPITMLQRLGRRWHLQALPALAVGAGSVQQASATAAAGLEALIRTDPSQWHAFSRVWPDP